MARATAPRLRKISLREDFTRATGSPLRVDEEAGIIYRVKILGWESANSRRYEPDAYRRALRLYEGAKSYSNHPDRPGKTRDNDDALGIWHNPVCEADGGYADLHYLKTHPMAARIVEDAKRGMGVFGASHNADGQGSNEGGVFVVAEITEVRSVDIVTDPATVRNLWESRTVKTTLRKLIESSKASAKVKAKLLEMGSMCEDDLMGQEMDEPAADEDPKAKVAAAIGALANSGDAADHELATKLMRLLKPETVEEEEDEEEQPTEESEDDEDDDDGEKPAKESKKARRQKVGTVGLTEAKARSLCKLAGIDPADKANATLLESLKGASEDAALKILEWAKAKAAPQQARGPRSQGPGRPLAESKAVPATAEEQATALLR